VVVVAGVVVGAAVLVGLWWPQVVARAAGCGPSCCVLRRLVCRAVVDRTRAEGASNLPVSLALVCPASMCTHAHKVAQERKKWQDVDIR
jgi:hypothetical protein